MPNVQRSGMPIIGASATKLLEPKINLIQPQISMAGIANLGTGAAESQRKSQDSVMQEPTINIGSSLPQISQQLMAGMAVKKENPANISCSASSSTNVLYLN